MHALGLVSGLSFCVVNDKLILLDLASDSYFQLHSVEADALLHAATGEDLGPRPLSLLLQAGVVEWQSHPTQIRPVRLRPPVASLLEGSSPGDSSVRSIAQVTLRILWIRTWLRLGRLAGLVDSLRLAKIQRGGPRISPDGEALSFAACRQWVPLATRCLPDSLALAFHLTKCGFDADLVIGVKLDPFAAHAWVQHDGVVLNDGLDGVLDFTPILVV